MTHLLTDYTKKELRGEIALLRRELVALRRDRDGLAALCEERTKAMEFSIAALDRADAICPVNSSAETLVRTATAAAKTALALTPEQALQRKEGGR